VAAAVGHGAVDASATRGEAADVRPADSICRELAGSNCDLAGWVIDNGERHSI
jgi:hypothetical protein